MGERLRRVAAAGGAVTMSALGFAWGYVTVVVALGSDTGEPHPDARLLVAVSGGAGVVAALFSAAWGVAYLARRHTGGRQAGAAAVALVLLAVWMLPAWASTAD